jgi:Flp pilus assembly protein protease CpaA
MHGSFLMAFYPTDKVWFPAPLWVWALLVAATTIACVTDLRTMRIPNWLTLPLLALGLAHAGWVGGMAGLGQSALGMLIAGGIFIAAYTLAGGGAGDAKLMMALGAWVGAERSALLVMCVAIAGFIWSIVITIKRSGARDVPLMILHSLASSASGLRKIITGRAATSHVMQRAIQPRFKGWYPYAPAILAGTIGAWWYWETRGSIIK